VIEQLAEALLAKAAEGKLLRTGKVRADTTVVSANVQRPTDSGLLAGAIGAMNWQVRRIKAVGAAPRTRWRDHTRAAGRRARQINSCRDRAGRRRPGRRRSRGRRPGCTVAIPRKGQPGPARRAVEHRRSFRRPVKWRTGSEGRIAHFKRRSSWDRTLLDGLTDARITHNLTKVSALAA
jgi:IS5 family transposase